MATRRPQDLVFSLFGEYLLDRPGPVWVGSLIELLTPFDLSENAVRTALSRMSRRGWLESERRGRTAWYDLTARGRRLLEEGAERIHHPPRDEPWDGAWSLVTYSIPEESRDLRDRLRVGLTWLGCGSLGGGLWISPHDVAGAVADLADAIGVADLVEVFRGSHVGFSDPARLVDRCWDLRGVDARYGAFVERFEPRFLESRRAARAGDLDPAEAYVRRFDLIHAYREFPAVDPYLPATLLPPDWCGDLAADLFERYRELLTEPADRHVDTVLVTAPDAAETTA